MDADIALTDMHLTPPDVVIAEADDGERPPPRRPPGPGEAPGALPSEEDASSTYDDHGSWQADLAAAEARDHDIDAALIVAAVVAWEVFHPETTEAHPDVQSSPDVDEACHLHTDGH